jgi:hypothetical protein
MEEGEGEREPLCRASKGDSELVPGCSEGDLPLPETEGVTGREPTKVSDLARIRLRLRSNKTTSADCLDEGAYHLLLSGGLSASSGPAPSGGPKLGTLEGGAKSMLISGGDMVSAMPISLGVPLLLS